MEKKPSWSDALDKLKLILPTTIKAFAPAIGGYFKSFLLKLSVKLLGNAATKALGRFLLSLVGMSGGLYTWFATVQLKKLWKWLYPILKAAVYTIDQKPIDDANIKELEKNKTDGATLNEKIKDETNFLNGSKP